MNKKSTLFIFTVAIMFSIISAKGQDSTILVPDSVKVDLPEVVESQYEESVVYVGEDVTNEKDRKRQERDKKRQIRRKDELTFDEFISVWEKPKPTGNVFIDNFCQSTQSMLFSYKEINDSINFIKIEVYPCEDEGDGITSVVKITDGNGHQRTKQSVDAKWTAIGVNLLRFSFEATKMLASGVTYGIQVAQDPLQALAIAGALRQLGQAGKALKLLVREFESSGKLIKQQKELFATAKEN